MADLALNITARNQAQAVLNSLGSGLEQVAAQAKTAQQSLKAMGDGMVSAGTKLTAGVTAPILGFAAAAIKGAAEQEQLEVSFTTMLGSAEKAKTMMADLSAFAASTPFESPEIQNASKMLLAFGVDAEQIIPTMTNLGDIAAGLNIPIGDMAYLFGTTKAAGRMMTADLNQFTSRGIPMIAALAETMGIAESEVKAAVEAGKVGFPEMEAALQSLTAEGGQFSGLMAAQSMTLAGLFSTLSDNVGLSLAEIGKVIIETFDLKTKLAGAIEWLVKAKDAMFAFAKSNPQMFKLGIIIAAVAAAIGPLLIGLGMLVGWMSAAMPVIGAVGAAFGLLLSPIALVVAAIAGIGAALVYFDVGGIGTALRVVKNAAVDLFAVFQRGDLFKVWEDGSSHLGDFAEALGMSEETATALGLAFYDIKGAFAEGGFAEAFKVWEDGSSYVGEFAIALGVSEDTVMKYGAALYTIKEAFAGLVTAFQAGELFTFWEDGSSHIGDFAVALGMSEEMATALGLAIYDIKGAFDAGGFAEVFKVWEDGSSYIGDLAVALGVSEEKATALGLAIYDIKGAFDAGGFAEVFATWEDGSSYIGDLAEALGVSEEATIAMGLAAYNLKEGWAAMWIAMPAAVDSAQAAISAAWATIQVGWDALVAIFGPSIDGLIASFGNFAIDITGLGDSFAELWAATQPVLSGLGTAVGVLGIVIGAGLGIVALTAINLLSATFNNLGAIVKVVVDQATLTLNTLSTVFGELVTGITAAIAGDWATAWASAQNIFVAFGTFVQTSLANFLLVISLAFSTIGTTISGTLSALGFTEAAATVQTATDKVKAFVEWLSKIVSGDVDLNLKVPEWITSLIAWAWPTLAEIGWVVTLTSWAWPVLGEVAWAVALMAWVWPTMPAIATWVQNLMDWEWPDVPAMPAWIERLLGWVWPTAPGTATSSAGDSSGAPTSTMPDTSGSWFGLPGNDGKSRGGLLGARPEMAGTSAGGGGMTIIINVSDNSLSDTRKLARELAYEVATEIRRKGF